MVVVGVTVALAVATRGDGGDAGDAGPATPEPAAGLERVGSVVVDEPGTLDIGEEPEGYRITYRVAEDNGDVFTEEVVVRRPFASERVTRRDGEEIGATRTAFGRLITDDQVFAVGPAVAGADLRLPPALEEARARGWLDLREQREVAGRRCQVYRFATSVSGGPLRPPEGDAVEYADACFDAAGLLLEEWWVLGGVAIRQRVATAVDAGAPADLGDEWSSAPPTLPVGRGGGSVLRLREGSAPPGPFFVVEAVPAGFEHVGRYSVIPPQGDAFNDATRRGTIVASTTDVWQRGIDVVLLDQGGTLEQHPVFEVDADNRILFIPDLGEAEIIVGLGGSEVRILRPSGRFIRVVGTLPVDDLLAVVRSLVETEGNELVVDER